MTGISQSHAEWLEKRGLSCETAAELGVYSRGPNIAFPVLADDGTELYAKLRSTAPDTKRFACYPAGVEQNRLFLEHTLRSEPEMSDFLVITEGECDAIAVRQVGVRYVVSMPSGAVEGLEGCRSKARLALCLPTDESDDPRQSSAPILKPAIAKFRRVVVLTDCDAPGRMLQEAIIELITPEFCAVATFPPQCKDANDVLMHERGDLVRREGEDDDTFEQRRDDWLNAAEIYGPTGLLRMINTARPIKSDGFVGFMSIDRTPPKTLSTGIDFLDPHMLLTRPEFVVIGGTAGAGKSTVTQNIVFNLCYKHNLKASIFNGEGQRSIITQRAQRFWRGVNPGADTGKRSVQEFRDKWIDDHFAFIMPPQDQPPTFEWILWAMEQQALFRQRDVFVIDPWNQVIHQRDNRMSMTEYVGNCIIRLKQLADRHRLILFVSHHVRKPSDPRTKPTGYDLMDSSHWINAADHLLIVWRPNKGENRTELIVEKSKDHELFGEPGSVHISMGPDTFKLNKMDPPRPEGSEPERNGTNGYASSQGDIAF